MHRRTVNGVIKSREELYIENEEKNNRYEREQNKESAMKWGGNEQVQRIVTLSNCIRIFMARRGGMEPLETSSSRASVRLVPIFVFL